MHAGCYAWKSYFLLPRNVLANELIRIQYFGRQEQVLQDESIQRLKQKPYYIKSRWTVYYIFTRNVSPTLSLSLSLSLPHSIPLACIRLQVWRWWEKLQASELNYTLTSVSKGGYGRPQRAKRRGVRRPMKVTDTILGFICKSFH
jgi:hypothetical protein